MKNEFKVTKSVMMSWAREYVLYGVANIIVFILWCVVGLIGIGMIALLCISREGDAFNWYLSILFTVLATYKLFFSRYAIWASRYRMLSKAYGTKEWTRTTEFFSDEIVVTDHTTVTKMPYKNIKKYTEKDNVIMIFFSGDLAIRLYKDAFVEGSWEDCKRIIEEKRG